MTNLFNNQLMSFIISISLCSILYVSYTGIGILVSKTLNIRLRRYTKYHFWVGWSSAILIFNIIHLVMPINVFCSIPVFVIGILYFIYYYKNKKITHKVDSYDVLYVILFVLMVSWLVMRAMLEPTNYDSGLYHFNSIRWLNQYGIVPGLGNLHGRLAFNQTYFTYVASLNFYPYFNHAHNIALVLLIIVFLADLLCSLRIVTSSMVKYYYGFDYKYCLVDTIKVSMIPILIFFSVKESISSPSTDLPSAILQMILMLLMLEALVTCCKHKIIAANLVKIVLIIAATAITIKLSNLVFCVSCVILSLGVMKYFLAGSFCNVKLNKVYFYVVVFLLIWMVRGVVVSGYPLYPSSFIKFNFEWTVPTEKAIDEANWAFSYARDPRASHWSQVLGTYDWISNWKRNILTNYKLEIIYPIKLFVLLATLTGGVYFKVRFKKYKQSKVVVVLILCLFPPLAGLVFWFFTAPDPRFAGAQFYLLCLIVISTLSYLCNELKMIRICMLLTVGSCYLMSYPLVGWAIDHPSEYKNISYSGYLPIKTVYYNSIATDSGLHVLVPKKGNQCWDSPLPATPYFNPKLALRKTEIYSGFKVVGNLP